jgi:hypothetical protein
VFTLGPTGPILAIKASASGGTYAICGDAFTPPKSATSDVFDTLASGAIPTSATAVLTGSATTNYLVKSMSFFNPTSAPLTLSVYCPSTTNQVFQGVIPAGGTIVGTSPGDWKIYNSSGSESEPMIKTDTFTISGSSLGPYPTNFTPDGKFMSAVIGTTAVAPEQFTLSSSGITFSGAVGAQITAGNFNGIGGAVSYSYSS